MRILHVIGSLSPADGGPPVFVRAAAKAWLQVGGTMEVTCLDSPQDPFVRDFPCPVHALGPIGGRFRYSPALRHWLRDNIQRFDAVVMNGIWIYANIAVRKAARSAGIPYGVYIHGALDPWFQHAFPLKHLKKSLYWPLQYRILRDADCVIFTNAAERELAKISFRPHRWNSVVIPYVNDDAPGDAAGQIAAFYEGFPALRDRRYLLFLARFHEKKGCDLLVEAFLKTAAAHPDVDLVMAGPDESGLQSKLQQMAENAGLASRVHWVGMLNGDRKWGALRAADAFVLPSHSENFGIAIVESLAVRRPVLITHKVNIWQEIEEDGAGLVDEDTLEGTERLLHNWLTMNPMDRDAMAERARACFERRFSGPASVFAMQRAFQQPGAENRISEPSLP